MLSVPLLRRRSLARLGSRTGLTRQVGGAHFLLHAADIGGAHLGVWGASRDGSWPVVSVGSSSARLSVVFVIVVVFVEGVEAIHARGAAVALRKILATLAFLFLAVDGVGDVEDFAEVDGAGGAEVDAALAASGGFQVLGCHDFFGGGAGVFLGLGEAVFLLAGVEWCGERGGIGCSVGGVCGLTDPRVVEELVDGISLLGIDGE